MKAWVGRKVALARLVRNRVSRVVAAPWLQGIAAVRMRVDRSTSRGPGARRDANGAGTDLPSCGGRVECGRLGT